MDLLDKDIIGTLKDVLGDEYGALIDEFDESTNAAINSIISECQSLSLEEKISEIHALRGSSANVGAQHLASLFMDIETGLKSNPEYDFELSLKGTKDYLEDSVLALKEML